MYRVPTACAARSVHSRLRRVQDQAHAAGAVVRARARADVEVRATEPAARSVVGRRRERARDVCVARQIAGVERHAVERDAVLVGAESEHGEAVGRSVEAGDERHARERRRHRRDVALQLGRRRFVGRSCARCRSRRASASCGSRAAGSTPCETTVSSCTTDESRVGDQHVLIGQALDLELAEVVADERVAHDVIAGPAGERDLETSLGCSCGFRG